MILSRNMETKNVFVIVREQVDIKIKLEKMADKEGFKTLSDFLRDQWRKWL